MTRSVQGALGPAVSDWACLDHFQPAFRDTPRSRSGRVRGFLRNVQVVFGARKRFRAFSGVFGCAEAFLGVLRYGRRRVRGFIRHVKLNGIWRVWTCLSAFGRV